jgi:hypothetical protein
MRPPVEWPTALRDLGERVPLLCHDLMRAGYPPGKEIGRLLGLVQDQQLEGTLTSREEAFAWLAREWPLPAPAGSADG